MKKLVQEKEKAIKLRQKGHTYKEILQEVDVAKSSLSLWLKDLSLTKKEKTALKYRKNANISRGRIKAAGVIHTKRLEREKSQYQSAKLLFQSNKDNPLFHTGLALYWAEGGKRTSQWQFMNSDADMQNVMLLWLEKFLNIQRSDVKFRLYAHKPYLSENLEDWWGKKLNLEPTQFLTTIIKPTGLGLKKRPNYKGCLRIEVRKSKAILNQMRFWQRMIVEYYRL
jgi:hypothetical protein